MSLHEIEYAGLFWITIDGAIKWWGSVARQLDKKENCISRNLKRKQKQKQKQKLKNQKKVFSSFFVNYQGFLLFFFFFHLVLFACLFVCYCFFDSTGTPTPYKALWKQKNKQTNKENKIDFGLMQ